MYSFLFTGPISTVTLLNIGNSVYTNQAEENLSNRFARMNPNSTKIRKLVVKPGKSRDPNIGNKIKPNYSNSKLTFLLLYPSFRRI